MGQVCYIPAPTTGDNMNFKTLNLDKVLTLDGPAQLKLIADLAAELDLSTTTLNARPDKQAFSAACKAGKGYYDAIAAGKLLTPQLLEASNEVAEQSKKLHDVEYLLSYASQDPDVRDKMKAVIRNDIDHLIDENLSPYTDLSPRLHFWQNLLFLSQYGGKKHNFSHVDTLDGEMKRHVIYEFNVKTRHGSTMTEPNLHLSTLHRLELIKDIEQETKGSNLTPKGMAVLHQLTERLGFHPTVMKQLAL
jgi:hypothetical protein